MRQLRAYGIYKLPGISRPVFALPADGGYFLYDSLREFLKPENGVLDFLRNTL